MKKSIVMRKITFIIILLSILCCPIFAEQYIFISIGNACSPYAINNNNEMVGSVGNNAFKWSQSEGITNLGTLPAPADYGSTARVINDNGVVAGHSDESNNSWHPYVWTDNEGMQEIPSLGGSQAPPIDINNKGQVVGWSGTPSDGWRAFLYTPGSGTQNLGTLGGSYRSQALAINEQGWVVGNATINAQVEYPWQEPMHPFLWKPSEGMIDLGMLPGRESSGFAADINEDGQVVGSTSCSYKLGNTTYYLHRPFLWTQDEGMVALPSPDYDSVTAISINNNGDVLLRARNIPDDPNDHSISRHYYHYLLVGDTLNELPNVSGFDTTRYQDINDEGNMAVFAYSYIYGENGEIIDWVMEGFLATIPTCTEYPIMDYNLDCKVDFFDYSEFSLEWEGDLTDLAEFVLQWMTCNLEPQSACWE